MRLAHEHIQIAPKYFDKWVIGGLTVESTSIFKEYTQIHLYHIIYPDVPQYQVMRICKAHDATIPNANEWRILNESDDPPKIINYNKLKSIWLIGSDGTPTLPRKGWLPIYPYMTSNLLLIRKIAFS